MVQLVMVLGGVLCFLAGALVLWGERAGLVGTKADEPGAGSGRAGLPQGLSIATRYLIGIVLLVWGYHLGVWAFSNTATAAGAIQFPKSKWWLIVLGGVVIGALSAGVDRLERRSADRGGASAE